MSRCAYSMPDLSSFALISGKLHTPPNEQALLPHPPLPALQADRRDLNTPDYDPEVLWLDPSDGHVLLNCEPNLTELINCGAITPVALHFISNRGAVPNLDWSSTHTSMWKRQQEARLHNGDLKRMHSVSLPILMVSAANRKEQTCWNRLIVSKRGAGWISNTIWTGVLFGFFASRG